MRALLPTALLLIAAACARADERTYDLRVLRVAGEPDVRVRLTVTDVEGDAVTVTREVTPGGTLRGRGRREERGERLVVRFDPPARGLTSALQLGAQSAPAPALSGEYRLRDGRVRGRLSDGLVALEEEGAETPLPPEAYALAPADRGWPRGPVEGSRDGDARIDLARENAAVSARLRTLTPRERDVRWPVVLCPGLAEDDQEGPLHPRARERLRHAVEAMREVGAHAIVVSGGNVHPAGTPHNEALEMKRALLAMGVPEDRIAIDPAAQHTTTNLRNAARFLFAHGLDRALVVSTPGQSFYMGHPAISTFHARCKRTLGYTVGRLIAVGLRRTDFVPSRRCLERGDDPLDP